MTCQCLSPDCAKSHQADFTCTAEATRMLRSRDFDEGVYEFCAWCAIAASATGIFETVTRHPAAGGQNRMAFGPGQWLSYRLWNEEVE